VRELYRHRKGEIVQPKASHLGLLLVLDRSNEKRHGGSAARNAPDAGETALLLPRAKSSPNAGKKLGWRDDAGGYGFPLLLQDKPAASPGCKIVLSPRAMLPLPLPKSPSESWLSRALPSVSSRPPPATSFLGLHVPSRRQGPLSWCAIDQANVVDHAGQRQIRVHDLHKWWNLFLHFVDLNLENCTVVLLSTAYLILDVRSLDNQGLSGFLVDKI
jgi:hypothetical protein